MLYALTVFPLKPQVFGLDPLTGAVVSGPVSISGPASRFSNGFTVLPNRNFLINTDLGSCTYNQFDPTTGAAIPGTTITVSGFSGCTGVATNGVHLFFSTISCCFTETDLTEFVISTKPVTSPFSCSPIVAECIQDISLVSFGATGVPGKPSCHAKTASNLAHQYGGIGNAASALGYSSVAS